MAYKRDSKAPRPTQTPLRRQLNEIKRKQFSWTLDITKNAPLMAVIQLGKELDDFFHGRAKHPKKGVHGRFTLANCQFAANASHIRIPNLGWVRMREALRFKGKIMSATVSRVADRWFVSITVGIGVSDHGVRAFATAYSDSQRTTYASTFYQDKVFPLLLLIDKLIGLRARARNDQRKRHHSKRIDRKINRAKDLVYDLHKRVCFRPCPEV
ncbi:MAG: hypothetical protein AAGA76_10885 [Pseudomonadota bacterium]